MSELAPLGAAAPEDDASSGAESLSEALQISFKLLRLLMIALAVYFLVSGVYTVETGTVVVQLRWGAIVGEPGLEARQPGGPYFALPAPIDERVVVDTSEKKLLIRKAFWFATESAEARVTTNDLDRLAIPKGGLVPGEDGALVTGDGNLVHGRWRVNYRVRNEDAARFVRTFGEMNSETRACVRAAAEQGIVRAVAGTTADAYLSSTFDREAIAREIQRSLDAMGTSLGDEAPRSGITITSVLLETATPPLATRAAFAEVSQAESEKAQLIERARRHRAKTMGEVAGRGYAALLRELEAVELAEGDEREAAERRLEALLRAPETGGKVSQLLSEATTYRTQVVAEVRGDAELFESMLASYKQAPRVLWTMLWKRTLADVLGGDVETFYLPGGTRQVYLELSRDPRIKLRREREKFDAERRKLRGDRDD